MDHHSRGVRGETTDVVVRGVGGAGAPTALAAVAAVVVVVVVVCTPGGGWSGGKSTHRLVPASTPFHADVPLGSVWKVDPDRAGPAISHR